ncbi:MAG TPA: Isoquinoline 1-oxidoreductase subunit, partial [Archangium sp.]|nr:Isoquinoline 1-oxidoreductase subunit [Archangium sp.]
MRNALALVASVPVLLAVGACRRQPEPVDARIGALPPAGPNELRPPEAFGVITDRADRSRALFLEASRVLLHPRCANCHPGGDSPYQGTEWQPHYPPVVRGPQDKGVVGMECTSCHQ